MKEQLIEQYCDDNTTLLFADGLDDAIIGIEEASMRIIYSVRKVIDILMAEGMTEEDAHEHYSFNIGGAYVGEQTPIWCDDLITP
jgi:hypothetical protein